MGRVLVGPVSRNVRAQNFLSSQMDDVLLSELVTGCIRPEKLDRLNVNDGGGQYDSSGGAGGQGNPQGSKCLGYVKSCMIFMIFLLTI